jgi:hypothetical protein
MPCSLKRRLAVTSRVAGEAVGIGGCLGMSGFANDARRGKARRCRTGSDIEN